jgi:hypothetical protein
MKASELRIGNLVYKNGIATEITVGTMLDILRYTTPFEPIPLTEEWLLKFGMELTDGFSNSRILKIQKHEYDCSNITFNPNEGLLRLSNGEQKGTTLIPHIKYVHQLQNLYFALTGEELTIKE